MYVIYHIASTMQVGPTPNGHPHTLYAKTYKTRHHAAATCSKFNVNAGNANGPQYAVASIDDYNNNVVVMVTRKHLLTGKEFQEPSNTPGFCSPSSEAYWSM
jgi:hypothetical protein